MEAEISTDTTITARDVERILRAAGLPKSFVRKLLSGGWTAAAGQDDAETEAVAVTETLNAAAARLRKSCHGQ